MVTGGHDAVWTAGKLRAGKEHMEDWAPLAVAGVAGISTFFVQFWINRGEPSAIKRIKLLSEVIEGMPENDLGRTKLAEARTTLAIRLSRSLIGLKGLTKVFRKGAWWSLGLGGALLIAWWVYALINPTSVGDRESDSVLYLSVTFFVLSPVLLAYSAMWPTFETTPVGRAVAAFFRR
jgi:hypothetical protein